MTQRIVSKEEIIWNLSALSQQHNFLRYGWFMTCIQVLASFCASKKPCRPLKVSYLPIPAIRLQSLVVILCFSASNLNSLLEALSNTVTSKMTSSKMYFHCFSSLYAFSFLSKESQRYRKAINWLSLQERRNDLALNSINTSEHDLPWQNLRVSRCRC